MGRRIIHSFSTRPLFINTYGVSPMKKLIGNIWYYALSVAYAKRSGASIDLYTDTLGSKLLSDIPYDNIYVTLDDLPSDLNPRFWAAGKMYALGKAGVGAIHIDGDVFLKSSELIEDIENSDWDFIAQSYEAGDWYKSEHPLFKRDLSYCKSHDLEVFSYGAYNTGVIGFRNQDLFNKFITGYKEMSLRFSKIGKDLLDNSPRLTPDLILEQQYVYQIAKNSKIKLILPNGWTDAPEKKYQHCLTSTKFNVLNKCQDTLRKVSPNIYNKISKLCQNTLIK